MAGTNQFLPFATGGSANVIDQATYAALTALLDNGFVAGVAESSHVNKVLRQAVFGTAAISKIISDANLNAVDDGNLANFCNALLGVLQRGGYMFSAAAGTADAITGTYTPGIAALTNGMTLYVRAGSANATTTPTFTPASGTIAAKTIVKGNGLALAAGDIAGAGHWIELQYDATLDKWVLLNPATGVTSTGITQAQADARYCGIGYLHVRDEKALATNGGSSVIGMQIRTLNTVVENTITGASLATNQITLPAGTYRCRARAPVNNVEGNKAVLYNVTDSSNTLLGSSNNGLSGQNSDSVVIGRFTIASTKVFELRHWIATATGGNGLGEAANVSTFTEIYSEVEIIKES